MKSNSAEVRALIQSIAVKMVLLEVQMDSKGIGSALYGKNVSLWSIYSSKELYVW